MAISFRSTPKHTPRDRTADAILSKEDFEDAVAAVNMTLADIAKQTGVNRQYLSEFKSGDRNLRAEMRQTLREFFEAKGIEFVAAEAADDDDDEPAQSTRPTRKQSGLVAVLPAPTIQIGIAADLPDADRAAALSELDAIVRENDRQLSLAAAYDSGFIFEAELSSDAKAINEELRQGLVYEAVLRRVLAGSFKARHAEGQAATHADLIAQQLLGHLPAASSATDPEPPADSSEQKPVAGSGADDAAGGEGPSAVKAKVTVFG